MTLNELIANTNANVKISQIYHGKDNWCRCGCGGNYYTEGDKGFTRALNKLNSGKLLCYDKLIEVSVSNGSGWINIPYLNPKTRADQNKCYCVYVEPAEA